jgi:hypothetical protein
MVEHPHSLWNMKVSGFTCIRNGKSLSSDSISLEDIDMLEWLSWTFVCSTDSSFFMQYRKRRPALALFVYTIQSMSSNIGKEDFFQSRIERTVRKNTAQPRINNTISIETESLKPGLPSPLNLSEGLGEKRRLRS